MIQMRSGVDPVQNTDFAVKTIRAAAEAGADYVQTPEMSNAVNRSRDGLMASLTTEDKDGMLAALRDLARAKNCISILVRLLCRSEKSRQPRAHHRTGRGYPRAL